MDLSTFLVEIRTYDNSVSTVWVHALVSDTNQSTYLGSVPTKGGEPTMVYFAMNEPLLEVQPATEMVNFVDAGIYAERLVAVPFSA